MSTPFLHVFGLGRYESKVKLSQMPDLGYVVFLCEDGEAFTSFYKDTEPEAIAAAKKQLSQIYENEKFSGMVEVSPDEVPKIIEFYKVHKLKALLGLSFPPQRGDVMRQYSKVLLNPDAVGKYFIEPAFWEHYCDEGRGDFSL